MCFILKYDRVKIVLCLNLYNFIIIGKFCCIKYFYIEKVLRLEVVVYFYKS